MRERIIEFFRSQSISFLFFLIGAAAGFVFAIVAYFIFASKKRKVRKGVTPVATEEIASTAAGDYDAARTGMDFKAKSKVFFALLATSITDLSEEYYDEKTKRYAVIGENKFFPEGFSMPLDFTVYEILGFVDIALTDLEKIYDNALSRKGFTIVYEAYRVFAGKIDEKDPKKLTLAKIAEVVCSYTDKPAKEPEHVGFFGKIKGRLLKAGASAALKPTIVPVVDDAVKEALEGLISDFNLLFSHNLRGGTYGLKYLVSADEEDAV